MNGSIFVINYNQVVTTLCEFSHVG